MRSPRISTRKTDHIKICATRPVDSGRANGLEDVVLVHRSLPEIDMEDVETSCILMGHRLSFPFVIEAITGGTPQAERINQRLAVAAEKLEVAMGVGSQRIAIENSALERSFRIVRETAPNAFLIANIGAPQLVAKHGLDQAKKAVEMISANALAVHLNTVQETIQPEGELLAKGVVGRIGEIVRQVDVPVIVKETGAGISAEEAMKLKAAGISAIDVAGVGGTDWARVEGYRNSGRRKKSRMELFYGWGISTAASVVEVKQATDLTTIASGGIRDGVQIAKAIALGASAAGAARILLSAALSSSTSVEQVIRTMHEEMRRVMFLTGSGSVADLQRAPLVIVGNTHHWLTQRGFDTARYARRK